MAKKSGGIVSRMIMGSEKAEGYARTTLPSNRWELFWDIFKGRFWKLVLINILIMLFCLPVIAIFLLRSMSIISYGGLYPFTQGFGVGYQATSMVGYAESIVYSTNISLYAFLPVAFVFVALGLSGGAYVIRNMVWTEGIFVANDFWRGIKLNFKQLLIVCLIYSIFFYATSISLAMLDYLTVIGEMKVWVAIVMRSVTIIIVVFYTIMTCHMITFSVTYDLKFKALYKNAFLFTIGLAPQNIIFGFLSVIPAGLGIICMTSLGGIGLLIGFIILLLFGLSIPLLVWTTYVQWAFDQFINPKAGVKTNRGIYQKIKGGESETERLYREQHELLPASAFGSRPIKPITDEELTIDELSEGFSRKDIEKLNESKQRLYEDNEKYIEEHKNDEQFVLARKVEEEKELARQKRIEQAKRELKKRK